MYRVYIVLECRYNNSIVQYYYYFKILISLFPYPSPLNWMWNCEPQVTLVVVMIFAFPQLPRSSYYIHFLIIFSNNSVRCKYILIRPISRCRRSNNYGWNNIARATKPKLIFFICFCSNDSRLYIHLYTLIIHKINIIVYYIKWID